MASTLTLTFNSISVVSIDEIINVNIDIGGGSTLNLFELFKATRTQNFQSALSDPYNNDTVASNFAEAWNLDYRLTGFNGARNNLNANVLDNVVTISMTEQSWQFLDPTGTAIDNGGINFVVNNDPLLLQKTLKISAYSANVSDRCGKVDVELTVQGGSEIYNAYVDNVLTVSNQTSPFDVTVNRGVAKSIRVVDSLSELIGTVQTIGTRKLISNDISLNVANYSSGSTITATVEFISEDISVYEYSLDNITFQVSNVFTGQAVGNYTIYVKDGFGCVVSKQFVVDGVTSITETVFDISNINSFRYAKVDNGKKNQLNTLSYNELRLISYQYKQMFLLNDIVTTQFKTNAQYIRAYKLVDGVDTDLTVLKKTDNTDLQIKTTSTYFDLGNGRSGIYFGVVDVLDFLTDAFVETVNYGNALPQWASSVGDLVTIEGIGQVPINEISYSDIYNSFILEFNIAYIGLEVERKISAQYNIQPYNIYEFDTTIVDNLFNVVIEVGTSAESIDFCYISECIEKVEDSKFLFDITYWDDENKGKFNYQTGIKNKLRIYGYQYDVGEQQTQGYNGDKEYYVTDNEIYDVQKFNFDRLSTQIANKLRLVVAHKYLLINGLFYKLAEVPEVESYGDSNFKKFVVNLKQSGEQFLTAEQEVISDSVEQQEIGIALGNAIGKGILAWTKNY